MRADTLDRATGRLLEEQRSPSRRTGELDNRGSHFYLALYWAQELAAQTGDADLAETFGPVAEALAASEERISSELLAVQGRPAQLGGYYRPSDDLAATVMRPSKTFNKIIDALV